MHLHLFKVNARETYVTAVPPMPVDLATAPAIVKEIVGFLEAHPGTTRQGVLEGLRPGVNPESPEAAELLLHLNNLVANGGAIEFFNATLVLPRGGPKPEEKKPEATAVEVAAADEAETAVEEEALPETNEPEAEVAAAPVAEEIQTPVVPEEPAVPADESAKPE